MEAELADWETRTLKVLTTRYFPEAPMASKTANAYTRRLTEPLTRLPLPCARLLSHAEGRELLVELSASLALGQGSGMSGGGSSELR